MTLKSIYSTQGWGPVVFYCKVEKHVFSNLVPAKKEQNILSSVAQILSSAQNIPRTPQSERGQSANFPVAGVNFLLKASALHIFCTHAVFHILIFSLFLHACYCT